MNSHACPDEAVLTEYVLGELTYDEAAMIDQHLERCVDCERRLSTLDQLTDPFISRLRMASAPTSEAYLREPEYQTAVRTISHLKILSENRSSPVQADSSGTLLPPLTKTLPENIGPYELQSVVGRGGVGIVYQAMDHHHARRVIVKVLTERALSHPKMLRRFEAEMQLARQLNHGNVMQAIDGGSHQGRQCLVFEFLDGRDVGAIMKQHRQLRIDDATEIVRQAASGLQYIRENGLVHRDLKPANLFLTRAGQIKILDLGLALLRDTSEAAGAGLTSPGRLMGTVDYMSPEQAEDTHQVDIRADIYSLGATLYALLCGNAPLRGKPDSSLMERLLSLSTGEFTPLSSLRPEVPDELSRIVHRMLARNPDDRYQTPGEVVTALAPWCLNAELQRLMS